MQESPLANFTCIIEDKVPLVLREDRDGVRFCLIKLKLALLQHFYEGSQGLI